MMTPDLMHKYQWVSTYHIVDNREAGLFLEMGLGKTVSTLTAINILMYQELTVNKVLIIAPKKVAENVWSDEIANWSHVKHLTLSKVMGTPKQRKMALMRKADIYIISRDNVAWLVGLYQMGWPFDMIVVDESSSFKNHDSERFKALKTVRPLSNRVVLLTGTPAPNGLIDLWAQLYLLDRGKRLCEWITGYRERWFTLQGGDGHVGGKYKLRPEADKEIYARIGDICISMKSNDYLELPDRVDNIVKIELPDKVQEAYHEFERDLVMQLKDGKEVTAVNAGVLAGKLTQFANGAIYDENKVYHEIHDEKLEMLAELLEAAQGKPVLVFYWFQHDLARILKKIKGCRQLKTMTDVADWNQGKVPIMLAHPQSAGHGLNLQAGGHLIIWFGLTWSLELYQQACKRLHRQGQVNTCIIHHIVAKNTMDMRIMRAIETKAAGQDALMEAVKAMFSEYS